jgi:hypothetical protein
MVRPETTEMIDRVVQDLASRATLPTPPWEYFVPRDGAEANILGAYHRVRDTIYLNQDYIEEVEDNPAQVIRLVVHEFRHYWQDQTKYSRNPNIRETDARRYETAYVGELVGYPDKPTNPIPARRCGWFLDHSIRENVPAEILTAGIVQKISTGRWIRYHLTREVDEDYVYQMWKAYEKLKEGAGQKSATYYNFTRYIWVLKQLQLVEVSRTEPSEFPNRDRTYYRVRPGGLEDPAWEDPQGAYLPMT